MLDKTMFRRPDNWVRPALGAAAVAVAVGLLWGLYLYSDLWMGTYLHNFVQGQAFWLTPLAVISIAIALLMAGFGYRTGGRDTYYSRSAETAEERARKRRVSNLYIVAAVVALLAGIGGLVWAIGWSGYAADQRYLGSVKTTTADQPQLAERAAWDVANAQAPGAQGTFRGKIVRTAYVADKGVYGSLIRTSGSGSSSYAGVMEQNLKFTGQSTVKMCTFSKSANMRLGGYFGHSLARALSHIQRGLIVDTSDTYGYCAGNTPMVIIPVKKLQGWWPAVQVPAGVAVYNGTTGELKLHQNMPQGTIPGPVYPLSLAARQREALTALDGSWWQSVRGQVGYSDTAGDKGDPNGSNRDELALATTTGDDVFATPLTLRGRSGAIAALGMSQAGSVTAGHLNTYEVYQLKVARKANSAVQDRIKTDYADLPDWAAGMKVFEIAPVSSQTWVASLGQQQNVAYRVRINADGSSCLETATGEKIRCGARTGGSFNTTSGGSTGAPVTLPSSAKDLAKMSDQQIAQLQTQLTGELLRRIQAHQK